MELQLILDKLLYRLEQFLAQIYFTRTVLVNGITNDQLVELQGKVLEIQSDAARCKRKLAVVDQIQVIHWVHDCNKALDLTVSYLNDTLRRLDCSKRFK